MNLYLVAEIGINHNGDLGMAKRLIDAAADAGFDAVKFQERTINAVYPQDFLDSPRENPWGTTQRDQKGGLEFSRGEYEAIAAHCADLGIDWSASTWDLEAQEFIREFDPPFNKVASAMLGHRLSVPRWMCCCRGDTRRVDGRQLTVQADGWTGCRQVISC